MDILKFAEEVDKEIDEKKYDDGEDTHFYMEDLDNEHYWPCKNPGEWFDENFGLGYVHRFFMCFYSGDKTTDPIDIWNKCVR